MSRKYGSFDVEIEYFDDGKIKNQTHTVSPLSQQEIANGWRLVLPKKKMINVTRKNESGEEVTIRKTNESFFKINLAQLPSHLFSKLKNVYRGGQFSQYITKDNCYVYIVNPTPVDNEIRTLLKYCLLHDSGLSTYTDEEKENIRNSLSLVNESEIKGWVVTKSNRLFGNI